MEPNNPVNENKAEVNEVKEDGKKKKERIWRKTYSHFLLTFNTNQCFRDLGDPECIKLMRLLANAIEQTLNQNTIQSLIEFKEQAVTTNHNNFNDDILEINFGDTRAELSPRQSLLHMHTMLAIDHKSMIHINDELIRNSVKKLTGMSIYYNHKLFSDSRTDIQNYINKYNEKYNPKYN